MGGIVQLISSSSTWTITDALTHSHLWCRYFRVRRWVIFSFNVCVYFAWVHGRFITYAFLSVPFQLLPVLLLLLLQLTPVASIMSNLLPDPSHISSHLFSIRNRLYADIYFFVFISGLMILFRLHWLNNPNPLVVLIRLEILRSKKAAWIVYNVNVILVWPFEVRLCHTAVNLALVNAGAM